MWQSKFLDEVFSCNLVFWLESENDNHKVLLIKAQRSEIHKTSKDWTVFQVFTYLKSFWKTVNYKIIHILILKNWIAPTVPIHLKWKNFNSFIC